MTSTTHSTPGYTKPVRTHDNLWEPITLEETANCYPSKGSAPGPDGITIEDVKSLRTPELAVILNSIMLCDRPPNCMLESRTRLIPKKSDAPQPGDYRPITVSSAILRSLHKILARRITNTIPIRQEQTAFRPLDGSSLNIYLLDLAIRYHRANFKPMYMASIDVSKAYDTVTHEALRDTITHYGFPQPMINHIMAV